jgi:hypothetical protein
MFKADRLAFFALLMPKNMVSFQIPLCTAYFNNLNKYKEFIKSFFQLN